MSLSAEEPRKLKDALAQDRAAVDDCFPCRAIGSAAFIGLGVYTFFSGHKQLRERRAEILKKKPFFGMAARQAGMTGIAAMLVGMGLYRFFS